MIATIGFELSPPPVRMAGLTGPASGSAMFSPSRPRIEKATAIWPPAFWWLWWWFMARRVGAMLPASPPSSLELKAMGWPSTTAGPFLSLVRVGAGSPG